MPDFNKLPASREQSLERIELITPVDSGDLPFTPRAIMSDQDQTIAILPVDANNNPSSVALTFLRGIWYPIRATRVLTSGTGSSNIWIGD